VDDFGVRKGYSLAYGLQDLPTPKQLQAEGERFRPYRTIPAWYCWRAVDTVLMVDPATNVQFDAS
jgi:DNA-3-methyladenine glycosylase II